MRVGVDLDNVVYPFVEMLGNWITITTGRPKEELPTETCWNFWRDQWGYTLEEFLKFYRDSVDEDFMFVLGFPIRDSIEGIKELKSLGHSIHIVTDRAVGTIPFRNTEKWLRLWEIPFDSLSFTADKTIVNVTTFIDDKPANVSALRDVGCQAFLYDYGRDDQAEFKNRNWVVKSWPEFIGKVKELG